MAAMATTMTKYTRNMVQAIGRRAPLVEHAQPDGQGQDRPDLEQVDRPQEARGKCVLLEKRREDSEVGRARHRFAHVVERKREDRLQGDDEPRVRDDGEDLLEPRVATHQGVEDAKQDAGEDRRRQRNEDDLADRRRSTARFEPGFHLGLLRFAQLHARRTRAPAPADRAPPAVRLPWRGRRRPTPATSAIRAPARRTSAAGPPRRRRSPGATRRHPPPARAGSCRGRRPPGPMWKRLVCHKSSV